MSIHDGHRQRLRARFQREGLSGFDEVQALELLLFYCIPRQDTNPLAHALIDRFGSFAAVMDASAQELREVPGIGEAVAAFLPLILEANRFYLVSRQKNTRILTSVDECGEYLVPYFNHCKNETVFVLCLDAKCQIICCKEVGEGSVNSAAVPIRRIVQIALDNNATTVVLAHNHPSGLALPSEEDIHTTGVLAAALKAVEITLADHVVVADSDYVSLAQSGLYRG